MEISGCLESRKYTFNYTTICGKWPKTCKITCMVYENYLNALNSCVRTVYGSLHYTLHTLAFHSIIKGRTGIQRHWFLPTTRLRA